MVPSTYFFLFDFSYFFRILMDSSLLHFQKVDFFFPAAGAARLKSEPLTRSTVKGSSSHFPRFHLGMHTAMEAILKADKFTLVNKLTKEDIWQMLDWKHVSWKRSLGCECPHERCSLQSLASPHPHSWPGLTQKMLLPHSSSTLFYLVACFSPEGNMPSLGILHSLELIETVLEGYWVITKKKKCQAFTSLPWESSKTSHLAWFMRTSYFICM